MFLFLLNKLFNRPATVALLLLAFTSVQGQIPSYTWSTVRMGGGGANPGIIAHPKVQNLYYMRTDVGTPYRWDHTSQRWVGLLHWVPESEWWRGAASALAIDPGDNTGNTVYVVVGKYNYAGDGDCFKSTDRGQTWTRTGLAVKSGANQDQLAGERLAVDPNNGSIVMYTSRENGTWRSTNAASSSMSWTKIDTLNGMFVQFDKSSGTVSNPTRTKTIYIGVAGQGVYRSTDGGSSFSKLSGSPANPRRAAISTTGVLYITHDAGVAKLSGTTWSNVSPSSEAYSAIAINPSDDNELVASVHKYSHGLDMYRSGNGGSSWTKFTKQRDVSECPWSPGWHFASSTFAFAWDPFNGDRVWFTDWYNAWETTDIWASTVTFKARAAGHENLVTTGMLASPPSGSNLLYSSTADVGGMDHSSLTEPPASLPWAKGMTEGSVTTGVAFQETNPSFVVRVARQGWNGVGRGAYSTDAGSTYTNFASIPGPGGKVAVSAGSETIVWATQGGKVYYSTNRGSAWTESAGAPSSVVGGSGV
jgi:xyloglucan-specific exo-beta-1,4-glucanase